MRYTLLVFRVVLLIPILLFGCNPNSSAGETKTQPSEEIMSQPSEISQPQVTMRDFVEDIYETASVFFEKEQLDSLRLECIVSDVPVSRIVLYPKSGMRYTLTDKTGTGAKESKDENESKLFRLTSIPKKEHDKFTRLFNGLFKESTYPIETTRTYCGPSRPKESKLLKITKSGRYLDAPSEHYVNDITINVTKIQDGFEVDFSPEILELFEMVKGEAYIPRNE